MRTGIKGFGIALVCGMLTIWMQAFTSVAVAVTDDFEDGDYTSNPAWSEHDDSGNMTPSVQSSIKKNGTYALRMAGSGNQNYGNLYVSFVPSGRFYAEEWVNVSWGSSSFSYPFGFLQYNYTIGVSGDCVIRLHANGVWKVWTGSSHTDGSTTISENTWYRISLEMDPDADTAVAKLYNSSGSLLETINHSGTISACNYFTLGGIENGNGSGINAYVDDVYYGGVPPTPTPTHTPTPTLTPTLTYTPTSTPTLTPTPTKNMESPGPPSAGSGMYTLQNLYDYLTSGAALTVQAGFQEPTSGPTIGTMKTTKEIGDGIKEKFDLCDAGADDVKSGKKFFSTVSGSWGVRTGTASSGGLLKTGQTSVYRAGDDGAYGKGVAFSYTAGANTVTDNFAHLEWAKDGSGAGCAGGGTKNWNDAIDWAESLIFDGKSDWRLPSITELQSLLVREAGNGAPYINKTYFRLMTLFCEPKPMVGTGPSMEYRLFCSTGN